MKKGSAAVSVSSNKILAFLINALLFCIATICILPFLLMFFMATQDNQMIFSGIRFRIGDALSLNLKAVVDADFFRSMGNSLIVALSSTFLTTFFSAMAGFAFAKYRFPHKEFLFKVVLMTMMVPLEIGLVAFAWEMRILHLSKTFFPLILPNIANAFGVFWMTQYMKDAFPFELIESGRIDGCNDMGVFLRLVLPIIKPALFTLAVISFLQSWNSYLLPMIMLNNPKMYTVPLVIASIGNMFVANYGARMLGVVLGILPIIILFFLFSKQITQGMAAGAVKG